LSTWKSTRLLDVVDVCEKNRKERDLINPNLMPKPTTDLKKKVVPKKLTTTQP